VTDVRMATMCKQDGDDAVVHDGSDWQHPPETIAQVRAKLAEAEAKLETAALSLDAAFQSRNESEIARAKLADKLADAEWREKYMALETKRATCCMAHEDTIARIEAALPAIEADHITSGGPGPLYAAGYADGCKSAVAQVRKTMREP
jgi:hypothetical protein